MRKHFRPEAEYSRKIGIATLGSMVFIGSTLLSANSQTNFGPGLQPRTAAQFTASQAKDVTPSAESQPPGAVRAEDAQVKDVAPSAESKPPGAVRAGDAQAKDVAPSAESQPQGAAQATAAQAQAVTPSATSQPQDAAPTCGSIGRAPQGVVPTSTTEAKPSAQKNTVKSPAKMELVDIFVHADDKEISKALDEIEKKVMGAKSSSKSTDERLEKVEQRVFGMARLGPYAARITALREAVTPLNEEISVSVNSPAKKDKHRKSLSELEVECFGHEIHGKSTDERIDGLEQFLFGMGRIGERKTRLTAIRDAVAAQDGEQTNDEPNEIKQPDSLTALEQKFYKEDFSSQPQDMRIMRLEQLVFGETKTGELPQRLQVLQKVVEENASKVSTAAAIHAANAGEGETHDKNPNFAVAMATGISNFKLKRFHHAQEDFEQAIAFKQNSPQALANLGSTLLMLKDPDGAQEAFKASYALEPFGPLGQYARKQLLGIVEQEAYRKTDPQDSPAFIEQSMRLMNRQTADSARRYASEALVTANNRIRLGDIEAQRITRESQQTIAAIRRDNRGGNGSGGLYRSRYRSGYNSNDGTAEVSNMAAIRSNYVLTDAQVQGNYARLEGTNKGTFVYESAANLKDQILAPLLPGDARLRALGTSLYARYYGEGMPSSDEEVTLFDPPPLELHAVAKQLLPKKQNSSSKAID